MKIKQLVSVYLGCRLGPTIEPHRISPYFLQAITIHNKGVDNLKL